MDRATSARLARIPQRDTGPELVVRHLLHALGARFRVHARDLPGSPDIVNRTRRWAVFVHGCFWHGHPGCPRATVPRRNRDFWIAKLRANRSRDERVRGELEKFGYRVVEVWECEVDRPDRLRRRLAREVVTPARSGTRTGARRA